MEEFLFMDIGRGGSHLKNKVDMISKYVGMVVELDLLLLDEMTRDDRLAEQLDNEYIYGDTDKLKAHIDNVRIHLDSGMLIQRDNDYVKCIYDDVKNMLDYVNYLQVRNKRLHLGLRWPGVDNELL